MLWWNRTKETDEIDKELPEDLKQFFHDNNPDAQQSDKYEISPQEVLVTKKLASIKNEYNYELDTYKKKNNMKAVGMINCSELQSKVVDCFKSMSFTSIDNCSKQIRANKGCIEFQVKALKKLHYEDCYSIEHCEKIRFLVDHLFTKNFGQYGEDMNEESLSKFDKDMDLNFMKVWK